MSEEVINSVTKTKKKQQKAEDFIGSARPVLEGVINNLKSSLVGLLSFIFILVSHRIKNLS